MSSWLNRLLDSLVPNFGMKWNYDRSFDFGRFFLTILMYTTEARIEWIKIIEGRMTWPASINVAICMYIRTSFFSWRFPWLLQLALHVFGEWVLVFNLFIFVGGCHQIFVEFVRIEYWHTDTVSKMFWRLWVIDWINYWMLWYCKSWTEVQAGAYQLKFECGGKPWRILVDTALSASMKK